MPVKKEPDKSFPKTIEEALAMFQMEHHAAGKDGKANYGTYTTLAGGLNAVQPATHLGLSHTQTFDYKVVGDKVITILKTRLLFTGEERDYDTLIESDLVIPDLVPNRGNIMQALGSAITYARRYALLAIYGLAGDDDDADSLSPKPETKKGITRTPARPSRKVEPKEEPSAQMITPAMRTEIQGLISRIRNKQDKDRILSAFKQEFKISANELSPQHITLAAHHQYLSEHIGKVELLPRQQ